MFIIIHNKLIKKFYFGTFGKHSVFGSSDISNRKPNLRNSYFQSRNDDATTFLWSEVWPNLQRSPNPPVIMSSSLASIVSDPEDTDTWRKLKDSKSLAKLHARFWGKGMVQEEVSNQTSDLSKREDLDINESTEDDTSESIEDDTKNGYVLVLDNKAFRHERIWVRVSAYTGRNWHCIHELGRPTISESTTSS